MSRLVIFGIGVLAAPAIYWVALKIAGAAEAFVRRRGKYAAGYFVRTLDARLEAGKHISARPLLSTRPIRGRAYLLTLFKEGPREPTAEETIREAPSTEPLDDEEEDECGTDVEDATYREREIEEMEAEDGPLEEAEAQAGIHADRERES